MKRADIKKRPMTATTLDSLEPEEKAYNELDEPNPCGALYFSVSKTVVGSECTYFLHVSTYTFN